MALLEKGTSIFAAFNDPLGVDHFYAQEQRNLEASEQIRAENEQWNAKVQAQRAKDGWEEVGIDPRMLDEGEHSVAIAEREGKTWLELQLECIGITHERRRAQHVESVEFAQRLGFSASDVWVREPVGPPQSYLQIGTTGLRKNRLRRSA